MAHRFDSQTLICNDYFIFNVKESLGSPFVVSKLGVEEAIGAGRRGNSEDVWNKMECCL